jgi:hypothetical protein
MQPLAGAPVGPRGNNVHECGPDQAKSAQAARKRNRRNKEPLSEPIVPDTQHSTAIGLTSQECQESRATTPAPDDLIGERVDRVLELASKAGQCSVSDTDIVKASKVRKVSDQTREEEMSLVRALSGAASSDRPHQERWVSVSSHSHTLRQS